MTEAGNLRTTIAITQIEATRLSPQQILIAWPDSADTEVDQYILKKREIRASIKQGEWTTVGTLSSDQRVDGDVLQITDTLSDSSIQQFEYAVDVELRDDSQYNEQEGAHVLASNLLICIDPGHYSGSNPIRSVDSYGYTEGDITLSLALKLREYLKNYYGIDSCLTRENGTITLGGYENGDLDRAHLSLRGEYAAKMGSNLFLSLHTNANKTNANGYETCNQPIGINKPILIVNTIAAASQTTVDLANQIGTYLAKASFDAGVSEIESFTTVSPNHVEEWTDEYNDTLLLPGSVYCRLTEDGSDYYGVLRGASGGGVPGIIIEHGMHTVAEVRKAAMEGDLISKWAEADACGIAAGFNLASYEDCLSR